MSELLLNQIQHSLNQVSDDVDRMGVNTTEHIEKVLGAMDDLAASVFANQIVLQALLKKYPLELADAMEIMDGFAAENGVDAPTTRSLVKFLITGERTE